MDKILPLSKDFMFKRIFTQNEDLLKRFLIDVLKLNIKEDDASLIIKSSELPKSKRKEYKKTVDIIAKIRDNKLNNNIIIDIEINTQKYNTIKLRNTLYNEKIVTNTTQEGTKYEQFKDYYFFQLNLNTNKFETNDIPEKIFQYRETY